MLYLVPSARSRNSCMRCTRACFAMSRVGIPSIPGCLRFCWKFQTVQKTKNANPSVSFQRYLVLLVIPHRFQATSGNTDLSFLPWIPLSIYIKMRLNATVRMDLAVLAKNKAGWSGSPLMIHPKFATKTRFWSSTCWVSETKQIICLNTTTETISQSFSLSRRRQGSLARKIMDDFWCSGK